MVLCLQLLGDSNKLQYDIWWEGAPWRYAFHLASRSYFRALDISAKVSCITPTVLKNFQWPLLPQLTLLTHTDIPSTHPNENPTRESSSSLCDAQHGADKRIIALQRKFRYHRTHVHYKVSPRWSGKACNVASPSWSRTKALSGTVQLSRSLCRPSCLPN